MHIQRSKPAEKGAFQVWHWQSQGASPQSGHQLLERPQKAFAGLMPLWQRPAWPPSARAQPVERLACQRRQLRHRLACTKALVFSAITLGSKRSLESYGRHAHDEHTMAMGGSRLSPNASPACSSTTRTKPASTVCMAAGSCAIATLRRQTSAAQPVHRQLTTLAREQTAKPGCKHCSMVWLGYNLHGACATALLRKLDKLNLHSMPGRVAHDADSRRACRVAK
jgi:hypothetical protein